MGVMGGIDIDANEALDRYLQYLEFDSVDMVADEELLWLFIDSVVPLLERLTGREVAK